MLCPKCQKEVLEDSKFCPFCGADLSAAATPEEIRTAAPAEAVVEQASPEPAAPESVPVQETAAPDVETAAPAKKGRSKKPLIIAAIAAVVVIAGIFGTRAVINHMHEKDYAAACKALATEDYEKALSGFEELGSFKDSKEQAEFCQDNIDYNKAAEVLESGDYDKARRAFKKLGDFKDSKEKVTLCDDLERYGEAEKLFAEKKYTEARAIYAELPREDTDHFPNAATHMTYCDNKQKYDAAAAKLNNKEYYAAYTAFSALGSFEDAHQKAESCKQKFPSTGEHHRNKKYSSKAVSLTIVPPSNGQYNYLKLYKGSDLVTCVALGKNQKATIRIPVGSYTIKDAYSTGAWFGDKDMFGDTGTYLKLTNGSKDTFKLEANMIYTLTLRSSKAKGDSVGSQSESRGSF